MPRHVSAGCMGVYIDWCLIYKGAFKLKSNNADDGYENVT